MQCQLCNNPATVHLTEIIEGEKIERHLCDQCARKEGITIKAQIPIGELLNSLANAQQDVKEHRNMACPQCQMNWVDFRKGGLLGCPNDYLAFGDPLASLIRRAQNGARKHVGKVPRNAGGLDTPINPRVTLMRLQQDLQKAVENEDYETAARLRDQIRNHA
jgi:protein arginine kinase activator